MEPQAITFSNHTHPRHFPLSQRTNPQIQSKIVVFSKPEDITKRFGLRLRDLRRERNLTQERMAINFGIDRSYISDVERGKKAVSLPMLEILSLGLQVSLSDLLSDI